MDSLQDHWLDFFHSRQDQDDWWARKKALWAKRDGEIKHVQGKGEIFQRVSYEQESEYAYLLHLSFLMKQEGQFHLEEMVTPYCLRFRNGKLEEHEEIPRTQTEEVRTLSPEVNQGTREARFSYDRMAAVQYAERWWNSYNPAYRKFEVDCTNYVSQCLFAGGAPMRGAPARETGWWYQGDNWSFSWAVAHSLRWYLSGSTSGLQGQEVERADELGHGDIICYDFEGDGRFDHNTIVVSKDAYGMPLVNAHTDNSRHRYWSYEDSTAWTPDIQYKFFRIG